MSEVAAGLATIATSGAALFVLLLYAPSLQAPFLAPKFAALELAATVGLVALALKRVTSGGPRWTRSIAAASWLVLITTGIAWAAAATRPLGAPYALDAVARWGSLFGLACAASVLDSAPDGARGRAELLATVTAAASIVATVGLLQHAELLPFPIPVISLPGSTFGNRNAAADVMAMALPLAVGAIAHARGRPAKVVLSIGAAIELVYLGVTRTRGAWLAGACGIGLALVLVKLRWSRTSRAIALGIVAIAAAAAALPGRFNAHDEGDAKRFASVFAVLEDGFDAHSTALKTRFGLWRRTLTMIRQHPLVGVGPGNWPVDFPLYAEPDATRDGVLTPVLEPRQAHNDPLERAAETGIFGLAAFGLLAAASAAAVRDRLRGSDPSCRLTAAAAASALLSLLVLGIASFPLEEPGTLTLAGLSLGLIAADLRGRSKAGLVNEETRESRDSSKDGEAAVIAVERPGMARIAAVKRPAIANTTVAVGAALVFCVGVREERRVRASFWLGKAERAMHDPGADATSAALRALRSALALAPGSYRGHLRMAQLKLREQQPIDSARAAKRAIAVEPYGRNAWGSLAAAELAADDFHNARQDASTALAILRDYPLALDVRARAEERDGDAQSARADREHLRTLADGTNDAAREARTLLQRSN